LPSRSGLTLNSAVLQEMERTVMRKVSWRLMPLLFTCFVAAFIDRVNVSFAKLAMLPALGLSQSEYALGAGIFFIGYFLFEVPSNLILARVGARLWIARIMLIWGVISCCMMLVTGARSFIALRFLLGAAEAGFFPGVIYYLTAWFPRVYRARAVSSFMLAAVFSFVVGSPLSGWLLEHPQLGLEGWQWLFLVEGLPSIGLGVVVWLALPDKPSDASWLSPIERDWLAQSLQAERAELEQRGQLTLGAALRDKRVLLLSLIYFLNVVGGYGLDFFTPTLLARAFPAVGTSTLGGLAAIPPLVALPLMILVGRRADRTRQYAWHVALAAFAFALGLALLALPLPPVLVLVALSVCVAARWSLIAPFWSLPTGLFTGAAAAGGIAWINSLGNLGGQAGPLILDSLATPGGSFSAGLAVFGVLLVACGGLALAFRRWQRT
jgi:sugar phosphate permease